MRNLLARLFGVKGRRGAEGEVRDAALSLARDWVLARGGQITESSADVFWGALPDGTCVAYTCAPSRLRQHPDLTLLTPNSPAFDALRWDVADRAASPVFHITPSPATAVALARAAFSPPFKGCRICADARLSGDESHLCAECPLRKGHLVLAGADAVRDVKIESERTQMAHEYTFRVSLASSRGRRTELIRIAVDGATGERLSPLSDALLQVAQAAPEGDKMPDPREYIPRAEAVLQPALQAAARLARAQGLLDYQRQQDDLAATFERLLIEAPEAGPRVLKAREQALERLANTFAIEVETQLVAAATIFTPVVEARVRLRDGMSVQAIIDPCRETVGPRCAACETVWQVGSRCAEGHITCMSCQTQCVHCGRRRCQVCATPAFETCAVCGGIICATCVRASARGHHQIRFASPAPTETPQHERPRRTPAADVPAEREADISDSEDNLCIGDLDAMTPATWRACVVWLLAAMDYRVEHERDCDTAGLVFVCRDKGALDHVSRDQGLGETARGSLLLAIGHRPARGADARLTHAHLTRILEDAEAQPGARVLLITTAHDESGAAHTPTDPDRARSIHLFDRSRLARWLSDRAAAYRRGREETAAATDARAAAAARLRATVVETLTAIATQIAHERAARSPGDGDAADRSARADALQGNAAVARQALSALETLIEQWEGTFDARATRYDTQELTAPPEEFDAMTHRAEHLLSVLRGASLPIAAADIGGLVGGWLVAMCDELAETCLALAARCQALDPLAWQAFDAVRNHALVQESVDHLAAARRAGARARKLLDEMAHGDQNSAIRSRAM